MPAPNRAPTGGEMRELLNLVTKALVTIEGVGKDVARLADDFKELKAEQRSISTAMTEVKESQIRMEGDHSSHVSSDTHIQAGLAESLAVLSSRINAVPTDKDHKASESNVSSRFDAIARDVAEAKAAALKVDQDAKEEIKALKATISTLKENRSYVLGVAAAVAVLGGTLVQVAFHFILK